MNEWKEFPADCPRCSKIAEAKQRAGEDDVWYDGDEAKCSTCKLPGRICADADHAYIVWEEEL